MGIAFDDILNLLFLFQRSILSKALLTNLTQGIKYKCNSFKATQHIKVTYRRATFFEKILGKTFQ